MQAFQLKIVIKNSKPPIWRRLIVPTGITFSQLSMILNEAMGWDGVHLFDFKFPNKEIRIAEEIDEMGILFGRFDCFEANKTFIRDYLEENKTFDYTYDFGDNWQHKITVEKIISDYEWDYPKVIKYKGNCPPEDCGGIYGYYMLWDKLNNKQLIENEYFEEYDDEYDEWLEEPYDIEKVNDILKNKFFYHWGKAEQRCQSKIYEDHANGKLGLKATKKDGNKQQEQPTDFQMKKMENFMKQVEESLHDGSFFSDEFRQLYEMDMIWKDKMQLNCLEDVFSDFTKEELLGIAREKGIKGISKCNKKVLIEKITYFMLQPEIMEYYFSYLLDRELEDFETLIKEPEKQEISELQYLSKLYEISYIGMLEIGIYGVPKDVVEAYQSIRTEEFEKRRRKNSYFLSCLRAASILYGIVPIKIILEMMKTNPNIEMTEQEIYEALEQLPVEYNNYILVGDMVYSELLYPDDRGLLEAQKGREYYIPTMKEIMDLGTLGYLPNQKEFKKLAYFFQNQLGIFREEAERITAVIQMKIGDGCDIEEIFEYLEEEEFLYIETQRQVEKLVELIIDVWNHTRMIVNRGFTLAETTKKSKAQKLPLREENNIIDFEAAKKKKIYPNELCPCGSGKKYKNCCGKK